MNPVAIITILGSLLPAILQALNIATGQWPQFIALWQHLSTINVPNLKNDVELLQTLLNIMNTSGLIKLDKPLVVDGHFGAQTFGAIKVLQTRLGFTIEEPLASLEMNAIAALLAKL
jgi:hypothetical protein